MSSISNAGPVTPDPTTGRVLADLGTALMCAVTGSLLLLVLEPGVHAGHEQQGLLLQLVSMVGCTAPFALVAVPIAFRAVRARLGDHSARRTTTLVVGPVAALSVAVGAWLHAALHGVTESPVAVLADALTVLVAVLPVVAAGTLPGRRPSALPTRRLVAVATGVALAAAVVGLGGAATTAASAATPGCLSGGPADRSYDVTAIDVDITTNKYGDHDPNGHMYALTSAIPAIRAEEQSHAVSIGLRDDPIQPLVIRANEGECVAISFTNQASGGDLGMHIDGLEYGDWSSGDAVGMNASSAVAKGQSVQYRYWVPNDAREEGGHYIHPGPGHRALIDHGLFGSFIVEPPGSTYWDASTVGQPLVSGWEAIIKPAGIDVACMPTSSTPTCGFREAVLLHHEFGNDNETLTDKNGQLLPLVDNTTGSYRPGEFALNYRSEPFRNRLLDFPLAKSHAYSSYTFGEPSTPMMRGYLADPTKIRLMHVGAEKFHIYHLHGGGDRWRFNPVADPTFSYADTGLQKDPSTNLAPSQRLDSQSIGPGESYNLELEGGAGGVQQSAGDFLYHCHIAKHYVSGMWSFWRVYDTRQPDLVPIADRPLPPTAVTSTGLIGKTFNGVKLTAKNLDSWIRPQLPPSGIQANGQDATVMDWKIAGTSANPLYLGAPADPTVYTDSPRGFAGQPNLLAVDQGHMTGDRPAILFDPVNGRPAYPLLRTHIGNRPPFTANGHTGAPWLGENADQPAAKGAVAPYAGRKDGLCPAGRMQRTYNVVAIAKPIRRTPSFVDDEGKIFVLAQDKDRILADGNQGEPLAIRANQGDCVAITLTSEIPDSKAFDKFSKVSMHIHHVQFDVQGSDGVSAGYAYEHSVRPYQVSSATLTSAAAKGSTTIKLSSLAGLTGSDANGKAAQKWIGIGEGTESIDIRQIQSVTARTNTVTLTQPLTSDHAAGQYAGTEFLQDRWYPDVQLDNVFWHDHVDGIHGWGHGLVGQLIIEPKGSTWTDPTTGKPVDSGTLVDINTTNPLVPGLVNGSFRELALWTINDNDADAYSTLNLKANPLVDRPDAANQFSSWKYGDPITPLPRLYPNDPLVVRTISISPTLDTLHLVGGRTLLEPRLTAPDANGDPQPAGTIIDTVHGGISERYTLVFNGSSPTMRMQPGDYLYANGLQHRLQDGAWGIMRILPGTVPDLQPLRGVNTPSTPYTMPTSTGAAPPPSAGPGNPCPDGAPARPFDLTAIDRSNTLPNGARTAYVPTGDVPAIQARTKLPEPLVMHVVAGECVTVTLRNQLTTPVGFAVGKLLRDGGSGGVNVGFNTEQNTAPGAVRQYVYYVPTDQLGSATVGDLANAQTLQRGLYGALVVAPASTVPGQPTIFRDPITGTLKDLGAQVLVRAPGHVPANYRDFTVTLADDDLQIGRDTMPYPTDARAGATLLNYKSAPTLGGDSVFTDPGDVPLLSGYAGDPAAVHVMLAPGSQNSHVFSLGGLRWPQDPRVPYSNWMTSQGMAGWETFDMQLVGGVGGGQPGDSFYGDQRLPFTAVGAWGLQRALPADSCTIRRVDGSVC
jgi:FtsP/CotA-like multicopper oxidase with cupredoxin domain